MKIPKMPRNYIKYPLPTDYPLNEAAHVGDSGFQITQYVEPSTRAVNRKTQSHMKFIDKIAPSAVDAYLNLKEAHKKMRQKMNREHQLKMKGEMDIPKIVPIRTLKKLNKTK